MGGQDEGARESGLYVLADLDGVSWRRVSVSPSIPLRPGERAVWGFIQLGRALVGLLAVWLLELAKAVALGVPPDGGAETEVGVVAALGAMSAAQLVVGAVALGLCARALGNLYRDRAFVTPPGGEPAAKGARTIAAGAALLAPASVLWILSTLAAVSVGQGAPGAGGGGLSALIAGAARPVAILSFAGAILLPPGAANLVSTPRGRMDVRARGLFFSFAYLGAILPLVSLAAVRGAGVDPAVALAQAVVGGPLGPLFTIASILIYRELVDDAAHAAYRRLGDATPAKDTPRRLSGAPVDG